MNAQTPPEKPQGSVTREGDFAVIRIPMDDVHGLRVALQPCSCAATKSKATAGIRWKLDRALAKIGAKL